MTKYLAPPVSHAQATRVADSLQRWTEETCRKLQEEGVDPQRAREAAADAAGRLCYEVHKRMTTEPEPDLNAGMMCRHGMLSGCGQCAEDRCPHGALVGDCPVVTCANSRWSKLAEGTAPGTERVGDGEGSE